MGKYDKKGGDSSNRNVQIEALQARSRADKAAQQQQARSAQGVHRDKIKHNRKFKDPFDEEQAIKRIIAEEDAELGKSPLNTLANTFNNSRNISQIDEAFEALILNPSNKVNEIFQKADLQVLTDAAERLMQKNGKHQIQTTFVDNFQKIINDRRGENTRPLKKK